MRHSRPRHDRIYATGPQLSYLRMLLDQAFARRVEGYYVRDWDRILKSEASTMISTLRERLGISDR
jgi:hypothetical protein